MRKLKQYIRTEMDVEFFACVHGVSMIFLYGFLQWLNHVKAVPFAVIFEMMVLAYVMSWTQKGLFIKEREYPEWEYRLRVCLWNVLPFVELGLAGKALGWFGGQHWSVVLAYYLIMACYFVMVWLFIKIFYEEDTEEMNRILKSRKGEEKGGKKTWNP